MSGQEDQEAFDSVEDAETFLGGLRSELDEGSHLHPTFAALSAAADSVRASYLSYAITPTKAAETFRLLRLVDDNDIEWTVGPSSGTWYRRRVGSPAWQSGPPPLMAEPKADSPAPWLSAELADLLPSARTAQLAEKQTQSSRAGIRVLDASEIPTVDEGEARDWLLAEWGDLEVHLQVMQQAVTQQSAQQQDIDRQTAMAAAQAPLMDTQDLGLPDPEPAVDEEPVDMLSLFVPPERRQDAVTLDDLLETPPSVRATLSVEDEPADPESSDQLSDSSQEPESSAPGEFQTFDLAPEKSSDDGSIDPYGLR
jgi:hypothetical protein